MKQNILLSIGRLNNKKILLPFIKNIPLKNFILYATQKSSLFLTKNKVKNILIYKISQAELKPNLADFLIQNRFDLIINIPTHSIYESKDKEYTDGQYIRSKAVENNTPLITEIEVAKLYLNSLAKNFSLIKIKEKRISPKTRPFTAFYLPLYDINKSYDFNYEFGPFFSGPYPVKGKVKKVKNFLGFKVNSLFGVPAGPLLNSRWMKTYYDLGFDILTYKTVRTVNVACHRPPNIMFIDPEKDYNYNLDDPAYLRKKSPSYNQISITNSFGVPSKEPDVWQEDIKRLLPQMKRGQLLILSIMGTIQEESTEKAYIADFVKCAALAKETGVKLIEVNLSCPNLGAGAIFNNIDLSKNILKEIRKVLINIPLLVKIGYFKDLITLKNFVLNTYKYVDCYVAINTVIKKVLKLNGKQALPGKARAISGTCGALIKKAGITTVKNLAKIRRQEKLNYKIAGVGGVMIPQDYFDYLKAGADMVQSATGAMWNPYLAYQIKKAESK